MASTYLTKTMTAGNNNTLKFTFSAWVKRTGLSSNDGMQFLSVSDEYIYLGFFSDSLRMEIHDADNVRLRSNAKFRDTNAWYHVVFTFDSTQATASDRMKMWVNNEQITDLDVANYPNQNYGTYIGTNTQHSLGRRENDDTDYFDGCMSHAHLTVGYAYTPSDFGETDSTTGIWKPKTSPSVTYGNNGFFLKFENSAAMGTDSSGNSNTFTVNGSMTQLIDTPSNVFATLNPLNVPASNGPTFSNNNTTSITSTATGSYKWGGCTTLGMTSGKYYCEAKATVDSTYSRNVIGITGDSANIARANGSILNGTHSWGWYSENGQISGNGNANIQSGTTYGTGDIVMIALDLDNNKLYFGKNGSWAYSGVPTSGSTGTGAISIIAANTTNDGAYFFAQTDDTGTSSPSKFEFNFGNGYFGTTAVSSAQNPDDGIGIFEYDVPAGYRALCTKSINAQEYS